MLPFDQRAGHLNGSKHCDLPDQAKLQFADTKKGVPKDPSLLLIED